MRLIGDVLLLLSAIGSACLLFAAWEAVRLGRRRRIPVPPGTQAVSILKPLHGAEPALLANLSTFLDQDHAGPIQIVCGVGRPDDGAVAAVRALKAAHPQADIALVVDGTPHGANAKVGNLLNMLPSARYPTLILSDSDMAVPRDYLAQVLAALEPAGVGAVTCLYRGRGDAGGWSRLAALGIDAHFLPGVLLGLALRLATPCMGSTIALSRETLAAIGGFESVADLLADDYAVGERVRALGLRVAVPPIVLSHGCTETSLRALLRHELRWNRTVAMIDPAGFAGSIVLHPLPIALIGAALTGAHPIGFGAVALAVAARLAVLFAVDRAACGGRSAPALWLLPRDLLSFGLFFATYLTRSVDWRGQGFSIAASGRLSAKQDRSP